MYFKTELDTFSKKLHTKSITEQITEVKEVGRHI